MTIAGNKRKHESKNPIQVALINRFKRHAAELTRRAAPKTVLDLGCGEGFMLDALLRANIDAKFTGIDLSETALAEARERLGSRAELEHADARQLVSDGRSFDMVMMLEVLEHIPDPEQMLPILKQLARGHVLLSVPREPFFCALNFMRGKNLRRLGNDPEHVNHWGRRGFIRFIEPHFEVLAAPAVFPWTMVLARPRR
jgi:2-polyprenyl-3-methyl-5-hydroxy-6-metoxy-1,4-benzoquinol methylase